MCNKIVEVSNLKKRYKGFYLEIVSLSVPKGSILGLIGPNGAGKTTTMKVLMNMVRADSGEVKIFDMDHIEDEKAIKNRIGYVGEDQFYYADKTVAWTGNFVSSFFDQWDKNIFQELITDFKISRTKKISELSKGMKVKFSLAVALSHNPDLILLDEPTAGLDPIIRREVLEILRGLAVDESKSVFICSHITDDISRIADYVTFLIDGKIAISGGKDDILSQWKRIHYKDGALDTGIIDSLKNRKKHMFGQSGVTDRYLDLKDSLAKGLAEESAKLENVSLDDILIACTKGDENVENS
ncbi:MAG: ABC transporter ATP-binding protein [Candidatus Aminicenantes bacterium]|nr:ABC transporter ATP-binding protein [Candidatus Aminicenantes bacterium]